MLFGKRKIPPRNWEVWVVKRGEVLPTQARLAVTGLTKREAIKTARDVQCYGDITEAFVREVEVTTC